MAVDAPAEVAGSAAPPAAAADNAATTEPAKTVPPAKAIMADLLAAVHAAVTACAPLAEVDWRAVAERSDGAAVPTAATLLGDAWVATLQRLVTLGAVFVRFSVNAAATEPCNCF